MTTVYDELYRIDDQQSYSQSCTEVEQRIVDNDELDKYFIIYMYLHIGSIRAGRRCQSFKQFIQSEHDINLNDNQLIKMNWFHLLTKE